MRPVLPLRVGVLSFAHYHANFWSEVFAARGVLAGVWDDDPARGREAADRFGTAFHVSLDALLAQSNAVAICSETSRHADLVDAAARQRCAVLCEKPLGTNLADCERIVRAVEVGELFFMQSFPKRFDPATHRLREAVQGGELGRITLARVRHGHFYGLQPDFRERWYARRALSGGGALLDEGVHAADLLAWLFGLPQTVVAQVSHEALGLEVEDLGVAVFRWESGLIGEIVSSFTFAAADVSVELYGTQGSLLLSGVDLASRDITSDGFMRRYCSDDAERRWQTLDVVPRFKLGAFHQQNAVAFIDALEQAKPPPITVADGLNACRMIDAAYRSAQSGTRATV
ncbi:MAG: Gfo/Idh/MocA family oxidoreductase [Casimicrobiaceae bacterium]